MYNVIIIIIFTIIIIIIHICLIGFYLATEKLSDPKMSQGLN